jgi:hypothetical protein
MRRAALAILPFALAACGCTLAQRFNAQAYHRYNDGRMAAVATALVQGRAEVDLPAAQDAPRVCRGRVDEAYLAIVAAGEAEQRSWRELLQAEESALRLIGDVVEAIAGRNGPEIQRLAPRIEVEAAALRQSRSQWINARQAVSTAMAHLREAWTAVWPAEDLDFDLNAAMQRARAQLPAPSAEAERALRYYHHAVYTRLAMAYLEVQPAELPDPQPPLPPGGEGLAEALARLERVLSVRYEMDEAVELDAARVRELGGGTTRDALQERPELRQGRYKGDMLAAAEARLRLLKYLDGLLAQCTQDANREGTKEWVVLWPQLPLETDILAFAGLPESPPADDLSGLTFRR